MAIQTMEELLKKYGSSVKGFVRGEKIEAKLLEVNKKLAIFDVGGKSEGILKDDYFQEAREFLKTLKPGDRVTALVMEPEDRDGNVVLSLRHAASDSQWAALEDHKSKGDELSVSVKGTSSSGISVEFDGINGFIPASQIGRETLKKLDKLSGSLKVKVIDIDKVRRKVTFSEREVSEAEEIKESQEAIKKIKV